MAAPRENAPETGRFRPRTIVVVVAGICVACATVSVGESTFRYVRDGASPPTSGSIHIGKDAPDGTDLAGFTLSPPNAAGRLVRR